MKEKVKIVKRSKSRGPASESNLVLKEGHLLFQDNQLVINLRQLVTGGAVYKKKEKRKKKKEKELN